MNDAPLYVVFINGEWFELEQDAWTDIALMADDPEGETDE